MVIDWISLFKDNDVSYTTRGKNTSPGWVSVKCPYCGNNDPSQHLGINLKSGYYSCWRDNQHKGKNVTDLTSKLLSTSQAQALKLLQAYATSDPDDFNAPQGFVALWQGTVTLPPQFKPIQQNTLTGKFWEYVNGRGYIPTDLFLSEYNLMACLVGDFKGRLIIPVYKDGALVGWQGRAINNADIRYKISSPEVKKCVYNLNLSKKRRVLYICEGPFDALMIDFYGSKHNATGCCIFGVKPTHDQVLQLANASRYYERVVTLFDNDEAGMQAAYALSDWFNVTIGRLPEGVKDPGSMSKQQVEEFLQCLMPSK